MKAHAHVPVLGPSRLACLCLAMALPSSRAERTVEAHAQQTPPTFPSGVELITVDAVVLDAKGHPVTSLRRDDFVVKEDGRAQEIVSFEPFAPDPVPEVAAVPAAVTSSEAAGPRSGRVFVVLVDDLRIEPPAATVARQTVASFLDRALRAGDEVTLGTSSGDVWWSARLPEGLEDLQAVLARVRGLETEPRGVDRMTEGEAYHIVKYESSSGALASDRSQLLLPGRAGGAVDPAPMPGSVKERVKKRWKDAYFCQDPHCDGLVRARATEIDSRSGNRTGVTLRAVRRGLDALSLVHGRKSLLLLSKGFLPDLGAELPEVVAASRETNTAIYFVDVRGLSALADPLSTAHSGAPPEPSDIGRTGFEQNVLESAGAVALADDTGGFSVRNTNDLAAGAERIADESRAYYLLGFHPPEGKAAGEWRSLRVEVKRPGLKVRARRGYTLRTAASTPAVAKAAVAGALDSAHDATGFPLRAMAFVLEPRPKDSTHVLVAAELDAGRIALDPKGGKRAGRLDFSVVTTHRDSGRGSRQDDTLELTPDGAGVLGWRALVRDFELPAGVHQARVVVRDAVSGATGSVSCRFEVPPPGDLHISTPIVTDRVEPAAEAGAPPRPALAVHRTFGPGGPLYCQFEVFGAARAPGQAPRVAAGLELRRPDGRIVLHAPPTPIAATADGRLVRLQGMDLEALESGLYELVLDVQDEVSGARATRRESFIVASEAAAR